MAKDKAANRATAINIQTRTPPRSEGQDGFTVFSLREKKNRRKGAALWRLGVENHNNSNGTTAFRPKPWTYAAASQSCD
ncbi:MAG: hypothetical protein WC989_07750 [Micavibrio sp.]